MRGQADVDSFVHPPEGFKPPLLPRARSCVVGVFREIQRHDVVKHDVRPKAFELDGLVLGGFSRPVSVGAMPAYLAWI